MKKLLLIIVIFLTATALFAGGAENKNNLSPGYLMNPSRNTETVRPDAIFYNPAGTAFMKDGLYLDIGNQFVLKDYEHKVTATNPAPALALFGTYNADNITYLYPSAEIVFKKDNFAVFGAFGIFAGGGLLEYTKGIYLSSGILGGLPLGVGIGAEHSMDVYSVTYGEMVGGSYVFNDMVSISAAIRFLQGSQTLEGNLKNDPTVGLLTVLTGMSGGTYSGKNLLKTEASATGIGGVFGVHFKPIEKLDLSATYQTITKMEYEFDKVDGPFAAAVAGYGFGKGKKFNNDLPAVLAVGAGYRILEELYASLSFNYYFNKQAKLGVADMKTSYDNTWEIGAGATYDFSKASVSLGGVYSKQGISKTENSAMGPVLDSFSIGAGTSLKFVEDLVIDIALLKPFYFAKEYETNLAGTDITMDLAKKSMFLFAIGATYKFF